MKEHPIIFNTDMVQAILEGRKTQTRRVIKFRTLSNPKSSIGHGGIYSIADIHYEASHLEKPNLPCPYGQVGDRLWVKEKHQLFTPISTSKIIINYPSNYKKACDPTATRYIKNPNKLSYYPKWRSSIFMPRWASRITLEITGVRVERLQEITFGDLKKEGLDTSDHKFFGNNVFEKLWDSLNAKNDWETNPWVWVIEFRRL